MTDYLKTPLDSLLETIDFTKIYDELYKIPGAVTSGELWAETHELILLALETWLARDVQEFTNVKIETPYNEGKIIIDLEADCRGTIAPFKKYNNCKILLDWKTTQSPVDTDSWKNKCVMSWQWKKYAETRPATLFIYRGISRSVYEPRKSKDETRNHERTREVIIEIPQNIAPAVQNQFGSVKAQMDALKPFVIWPQNTDSCWDFSVRCPEYDGCMSYGNPPKTLEYNKPLSYSSMQLFLRCPEKFRMRELRRSGAVELEDDPNDTDATVVGTMFHAAMAEIYRQIFGV